MKEIVGYIGYPIFEISMLADQVGSGAGVAVLALAIILGCVCSVLDGLKVSRKNVISIASSLMPFGLWFSLMSLPVSNAGVGNFFLELCAIFSLLILYSVLYKCYLLFSGKRYEVLLRPYFLLAVSVVVMRLFMPFVGK